MVMVRVESVRSFLTVVKPRFFWLRRDFFASRHCLNIIFHLAGLAGHKKNSVLGVVLNNLQSVTVRFDMSCVNSISDDFQCVFLLL